jgi:hypothetical protein
MIQKNNHFAQSTRRVHHATPLPNRWRPMDSEPYPVVTHSFTRLPWDFGNWNFQRFRRWVKGGVFDRIFEALMRILST